MDAYLIRPSYLVNYNFIRENFISGQHLSEVHPIEYGRHLRNSESLCECYLIKLTLH
jgi:hypothetical protein